MKVFMRFRLIVVPEKGEFFVFAEIRFNIQSLTWGSERGA